METLYNSLCDVNISVPFLVGAMFYFSWISQHWAVSKIQELIGRKELASTNRERSRALCAAHATPFIRAWKRIRHGHQQVFPKSRLSQTGAIGKNLIVVHTPTDRQPRRSGRQGHGGQGKTSSNDEGDGDGGEPPHPLVLDYEDLAHLLRVAVGTLKNRYSLDPTSLPPAILIPGCRGPRWLFPDVLQWLKDHRTPAAPSPAPAPKRKAGRPRIAISGKGGAA